VLFLVELAQLRERFGEERSTDVAQPDEEHRTRRRERRYFGWEWIALRRDRFNRHTSPSRALFSRLNGPASFELATESLEEIGRGRAREPVADEAIENRAESPERRHVLAVHDDTRFQRLDAKPEDPGIVGQQPRTRVPIEVDLVVGASALGHIVFPAKVRDDMMHECAGEW
jgi:hypothetical protein